MRKLGTRYDRPFNIFRNISLFMISVCLTVTLEANKRNFCEKKGTKQSLLAHLLSNLSQRMTCPI
jgi:hypothetical protein